MFAGVFQCPETRRQLTNQGGGERGREERGREERGREEGRRGGGEVNNTACPTCLEECWDSRTLFRHILRPSCQAGLGCSLAEFKRRWAARVRREKRQAISQTSPVTCGDRPSPPIHYGPIFGCVCCHGLQFLSSVVDLETVQTLRSRETRAVFIDLLYVARNPSLFVQLDKHWICRRCKDVVAQGSMPPMAARNMLGATWVEVPRRLRTLSQPEREMVSLTRVSKI